MAPSSRYTRAKRFLLKHLEEERFEEIYMNMPEHGCKQYIIQKAKELRTEICSASPDDSDVESYIFAYKVPSNYDAHKMWTDAQAFRKQVKKMNFSDSDDE